ncbi:hypothetical protein [Leucobacter sp. cx-169]|uniref:hypothetical protein n=1 Tax=Leucobacter sp. cx-169 TaxID=2770549 RepID=UPI00165DE025|nr:hypothetical protein [Leucobacter sp. cx-169]MBC9927216.1 hypothetical protein [Leucobacter sp. cx-169]
MSDSVREREALLPEAEPQNPCCPVCGEVTSFDADDFECANCLLIFSTTNLSASLADSSAPQCASECEDKHHREQIALHGYRYACRPCALSAGHTDVHFTGCRFERIPAEPNS